MDLGTARKRPWENDNPTDAQSGGPRSAIGPRKSSDPPLPQPADWYASDNQGRGHRRLPPLYISSHTTLTRPLASQTPRTPSPPPEGASADVHRPRSLSLFDISQAKRQRREDDREASRASFGLDPERALPPLPSTNHLSRAGVDLDYQVNRTATCCPHRCSNQTCSTVRNLIRTLASEVVLLDSRLRSILRGESQSSKEVPDGESTTDADSLQWMLTLVQWSNLQVRDLIEPFLSHKPEYEGRSLGDIPPITACPENMERSYQTLGRGEGSSRGSNIPGSTSGFQEPSRPSFSFEEDRRPPYGNDLTPMAGSPRRTASVSGSSMFAPHSPASAPQPPRANFLPSPTSMNFPHPPSLPPISPPSGAVQTSAQSVHLQELQHQVSIKTLAHQTLQREYDSLLQKLERQRTKCTALEKKFEVSDIEINSLTDEKEKLQMQISSLEGQVEELQQSRDEARGQLVTNGAQYMRIMEMANRLQAQGAEDKRRGEVEKQGLERRVQLLEEAMVTGAEKPDPTPSKPTQMLNPDPTASADKSMSPVSAETISVLRAEISRLRARTQILETALQTLRNESISIQAAAQQLAASGRRIDDAVDNAISR